MSYHQNTRVGPYGIVRQHVHLTNDAQQVHLHVFGENDEVQNPSKPVFVSGEIDLKNNHSVELNKPGGSVIGHSSVVSWLIRKATYIILHQLRGFTAGLWEIAVVKVH